MTAERIVAEFGADAGEQIVALADFLREQPPEATPSVPRRVVPVARSDARAAAGTAGDVVNAKIVREAAEAIAGPDAPESEAVAEAVALLKEIGPRDAREALIARRLVALDAMAMETLALARASTGLLRLYGASGCAQPGGDLA